MAYRYLTNNEILTKIIYLFLIGDTESNNSLNIESPSVVLAHNKSGRFESRFSTVKINSSNSLMFKNMEGSILGVWVAHAEGN